MKEKKTLVLGANTDPQRYGNIASLRLQAHGIPVLLVGKRGGQVGEDVIHTEIPADAQVDTVTLYLAPGNQTRLIPEILALKPRRIIFNPGTENPELADQATAAGIEVLEACTLVLLATGQY
ncbi:MAG: CoA-binding protein [Flavobacteriales bacterium]|jgi:hypothetical protein|nr:CoA-binding protein [Flavobacteriales bacterium]